VLVLTLTRLITHCLVLAIAASFTGVQFVNRAFTVPHLGPSVVDAAGLVDMASREGRAGTIIKPVEIPSGPAFSTAVAHHKVPAAASSRPPSVFRGRGYTLLGVVPNVPIVRGNRFAFGNCTYYVYNRRPVPWRGDAWAWYKNARSMGFATGRSPRRGSIMVTWESGYGHVAYVEAVNRDGSWVVSEMNWVAFNAVDRRLIRPGGVPLIGFIY
jgi:hypothetical protein